MLGGTAGCTAVPDEPLSLSMVRHSHAAAPGGGAAYAYVAGADVARLEPIGGDTLLIIDRGVDRLPLWHDDRVIRHIALPPAVTIHDAIVLDWPTRIFAVAFRGAERELLLLRSTDDRMVIDGTVALHGRSSLKNPNIVTLGNAVRGGVWLAQSRPGDLSRIAADGTVTSRIGWRPDWIERFGFPASPRPYIAALREDDERRLWLFWRVAHAATGPALIDASRGAGPNQRRDLFDTVVEVLDARAGRVLARGHVAGDLIDLLPDGRAWMYRRSAEDGDSVAIHTFHIVHGR